MRDAEFRAMLHASRERNKHNSYAYTNNPTSYEVPTFSKSERKNIEVGNISLTTSEPDFEFDPYILEEF